MSENALFQNSFYNGNNFNWILYGVNIVLYTHTMYIYTSPKSTGQKSARFFMIFSTVMLALNTIYVITQSILGEEMWIINASYSGGSAAYLAANASDWYQTMGTTSWVILELMSDGLLIYRCLIVWKDRRIIILPCFLWFATMAFGIFDVYVSGSPNANFFVGFAARIGLTYVAVSIGLNVLVTSLICGRILYYAYSTRQQFGPAIAETYLSTVALIVESALPYTLCGVAFIVSYGMGSDISIVFLSLYAMFMCVSPQMLILRVASGRAWNADVGTRTVTTMRFERVTDPVAGLSTVDNTNPRKVSTLKHSEESGSSV